MKDTQMYRMSVTEKEATLLQEIRLLETAYDEEHVHTVTAIGDVGFMDWLDRIVSMAVDASSQPHDGKLFGFVIKLYRDTARRKEQYRFMLALIDTTMGPEESGPNDPVFPEIDERLLLN